MGKIVAPYLATASKKRRPLVISDSLFANRILLPFSMAASVGFNPATPVIADMT